jgi:hypothetical protein
MSPANNAALYFSQGPKIQSRFSVDPIPYVQITHLQLLHEVLIAEQSMNLTTVTERAMFLLCDGGN